MPKYCYDYETGECEWIDRYSPKAEHEPDLV